MLKNTKRVLSIIFASVLLLNLLQTNVYAESVAGTEENASYKATLDDEFADNRVMVILDNETSLAVDQFSTTTFSGIRCKEVESLTTAKEDKVQEKMSDIAAELNEVAISRNAAEIVTTENIMKIAATDEYLSSYKQVLCIELEETGKEKVLEAIAMLEKQDGVVYAGPDYVLTVDSKTPNDPYYIDGRQWAIDKIRLPDAWDVATGTLYVTVAVIDTGIYGNHPEMSGRIMVGKCRDFTSGYGLPTGMPTDDNGHGTFVAGIIGAAGNNGVGVVGTCWNVCLASLKAFNSAGRGYSSHVAMAINFAESQDIPIINLSAGWYEGNERYNYALNAVISSYSGLFVCAADNDSTNIDTATIYPADYNLSNMIVVGASDENDAKCSFSNYGRTRVDIFAPGTNLYSTTSGGGYGVNSGTSFAAPYVAGVAALLLSMDSSLTATELKAIIERNVYEISGLANYCVTGGRLNAVQVLSDEALHTYTTCSQWTMWYHRMYCSDCQKYILRCHTFEIFEDVAICGECGYSFDIME